MQFSESTLYRAAFCLALALSISLPLSLLYSLPLSSLWHLCLYGKFNENGQRVKCFRCLLSMTNITYNEKPKPIQQNIKTSPHTELKYRRGRRTGGTGCPNISWSSA